jgi:hypothetical protein
MGNYQKFHVKFVSDLRQVGGFLHQKNRPPWYNWNIIVSSVKYHNTLNKLLTCAHNFPTQNLFRYDFVS